MKKVISTILACLFLATSAFATTTTTFLESGSAATQSTVFFTSTTGTWATSTSVYYSGGASLEGSSGAGNATYSATTPSGILADSGSQFTFYYRFDNLPGGNLAICNIVQAGGTTVWSVQQRTTGLLGNVPAGATAVNGSTTLSTNTWYRISVAYYITNTTTYTVKVYVNGNLDSTTNAGTLAHVTSDHLVFGMPIAGGGANHNTWFENIYVATGGASSSSQPDSGNILVTAKRPYANGTTNGYTTQIGSGPASPYGTGHAQQENERPLNTANGWSMVGAGSAITEEYNIEGLSVGDVNLTGATIVDWEAWVYSSSLAGETSQIIYNGSSSNISLTNSNTLFTEIAGSTSYPAGTGSDIGEITSTGLTTVSLYEAGVMIAYKPAIVSSTHGFDFGF